MPIRAFLTRSIKALLIVALFATHSWAADPTHYWSLDENTGTAANDTGTDGSADCSFSNTPVWTPGKVGTSALDFERGDGDALGCTGSHLTSNNDWTIAAWIKTETTSDAENPVVQAGDFAASEMSGILLRLPQSADPTLRCMAVVGTDSLESADSTSTITAGEWTHVACKKSGTTLQPYINGQPNGSPVTLTSATMDYTSDNPLILIGSGYDSTFDGVIDEVRFYNSAISDSEIAQLASVEGGSVVRYVDDNLSGTCSGTSYSIANRNCTGNDGAAYKTFAAAKAAWATGDTIYVRAGTYAEQIDLTALTGGTSGTPTIIARYQNETVTMQPTVQAVYGTYLTDNVHYVTIDGFIFDGVNAADQAPAFDIESSGSGPDHITIKNNEIKNFHGMAFYLAANNIMVQNNVVHDLVSDCVPGNRWYGVYQASGNDNIYEGNTFYNTPGGAMQIYPNSSSGLVIKNNVFYHNNTCSTSFNEAVLIQSSTGPQIYNNIFYSNGKTGGGLSGAIGIRGGTSDALIYNNTIYDHSDGGIIIDSGSTGTLATNNIIYQSGGIVGTPVTSTTNLTTDPLFVDAANGDFRLCSAAGVPDAGCSGASDAIDAGTNLGSPYNVDYAGINRPQGSAWDIGAYESKVYRVGPIVFQ